MPDKERIDNLEKKVDKIADAVLKQSEDKNSLVNRSLFESSRQIKEDRNADNRKHTGTVSSEDYKSAVDMMTDGIEATLNKFLSAQDRMITSAADRDPSKYAASQKEALEQSKALSTLLKAQAEFERNTVKFDPKKMNFGEYSKVVEKQIENKQKNVEKINEVTDKRLAIIEASSLSQIQKEWAKKTVNDIRKQLLDVNEENGPGISDRLLGAASGLFKGEGLGKVITTAVADVPYLGAIAAAVKVANVLLEGLGKSLDSAINLQDQYLSGIATRLNGSADYQENAWKEILANMSDFASSQYVSMQNLTKNVATLASEGVAYNLEERALLETIKDRVVTTFGVVEGQLDRLVRMQQADITQSQMGAEAELTRMFNSMFKDTSYLSGVYDSVASALVDATATRSYGEAVEINFAAQKWLGSLYSLGMSESAVTSIAQGLTNLATGNINDLNGTPLGNLFALSARDANLSYTDILTEGLNASNINDLLKAMVLYLQQLAQNTSGNVAKSAIYNAIGGNLSFSDIRAISNLTEGDISAIYSNTQNYESTKQILRGEFSKIGERTPYATRVNNLLDNTLLNIGNSMISENGMLDYTLWRIADYLPEGLSKLTKFFVGMANIGEIGEGLLDSIKSVGNEVFGNVESNILNYLDSNTVDLLARGFQYTPTITGQASPSISYSAAIANTSTLDRAAYSLYNNANAPTITATSITGQGGVTRDISDLYSELFEQQLHPIRVALAKVEEEAKGDLGIGINGMLVDVQDSDVNSIINNVYTIRGTY